MNYGRNKILIRFYAKISFCLMTIVLASCSPKSVENTFNIPQIDPSLYEQLEELPSIHGNNRAKIAQISDIHHFAPSLYSKNDPIFARFAANNDGRTVLYTREILESLKDNLKNQGVDTLLVSGDLSIWGSRITHEDLARIFKGYEEEGIDVFVTPGNHDLLNIKAARLVESKTERIDSVSPGEFRGIYGDFGFSQALLSDDESLSYLAELKGGILLLSLDSNFYKDNDSLGYSVSHGTIGESQYEFIERALDLAGPRKRDMIVMTHHNLLEHYETESDLSNFMIDDKGKLLSLLKREGVTLALSGHIHKSDIKRDGLSGFYSAALTSLALYPHVYRLISVDQDSFALSSERLSFIYDEKTNREIEEYTRRMGYVKIYTSQFQRLEKEYDSSQAREMADYFYLLNLYAQQGLESYIPETLLHNQVAALFAESVSPLNRFAHILPLDSFPNDWQARIPIE